MGDRLFCDLHDCAFDYIVQLRINNLLDEAWCLIQFSAILIYGDTTGQGLG